MDLKKNIDHNQLYGSILHAYEPVNNDHGVLETEVITAPSKRSRSPQSSSKSKKLLEIQNIESQNKN